RNGHIQRNGPEQRHAAAVHSVERDAATSTTKLSGNRDRVFLTKTAKSQFWGRNWKLGESRLTKLRGAHLAESTEHSCEVLLGLESTCNGYIEDACVFFYQQLLGSLHPCPQNKLVRSNSRRLMKHLREVCRAQLCF